MKRRDPGNEVDYNAFSRLHPFFYMGGVSRKVIPPGFVTPVSGISETRKKQVTHSTPTPRSAVPYACAQPYHPGSGSHGQLFRPC